MKPVLMAAALSLTMVSAAGMAAAAGPQPKLGATPDGHAVVAQAIPTNPQIQPGAPAPSAGSDSRATSPMAARPAVPPPTLIGKDLVNSKGKQIGKVAKIDGDEVVVAVGGFLGIGAHDVALPWKSLTVVGSGSKLKVETAMTEDELKQLPEYKSSESGQSSIRAMPPRSGGMGGSTSSPTR